MNLRPFGLVTLLATALAVAGCDPCAGVVACEGEVQGRATGRIVSYPTRTGVSGVRIVVTPAGGGAAVSTTTDADGFWSAGFATDASAGATTQATITVSAGGSSGEYTVPDVVVRTTTRRGEATDLGRWFATPQVRFAGELVPRPGIDLTNAVVLVERTGGANSSISSVMAPLAGRRFYVEGTVNDLAPVGVRLTIRGPRLSREYVRENVPLFPLYRDTMPQVQGTFSVGAALNYVARIERRGTNVPMAGVRSVFRRTGGIATGRDSIVATSTSDGLVLLDLLPQSDGVVRGDLDLTPPAPFARVTVRGIQLSTQDDEALRLAYVHRFGAQVSAVVELFERSSQRPLANTTAEFRPKSGPLTTTIRGTTNAEGRMGILAAVNSTAPTRGDLVVFHLPPRAPEIIPDIQVVAAEDDVQRLAAIAGIGPSLLYLGALQDINTFSPITGGSVEFRRTGGIAVRESVFTWPLTPEGLFRISPTPLADGEVIGDLTFRLSSPYRDTTIVGVRLNTFLDDGHRNAGIFRVRRN